MQKTELDIASEALATLENQNERVFEASQESKYKYEKLQSAIDAESKRQHEFDSSIKLTENDIAHRKAQISEREASREKLAEKQAEFEKVLEEKKKNLENSRERETELAGKNDKARGGHRCSPRKTSRSREEARRPARGAEEERGPPCRIEDPSVRPRRDEKSDGEKTASIESDIAKYSESIALLEDRIQKAVKVIADYDAKAAEFREKSKEHEESVEAEKRKKQDYIDKANAVYLDYTAKKHRIDAIRRMEELFEGYSQSVRFIMSEYEAGRVDGTKQVAASGDDRPGGRIWGPVSRHISVNNKYVLAIETALGANIQNIIVDDDATAKAAIAHLKKKSAGRATFYPISSMKPRYSPIPESECQSSRAT